MRKMMVLAGVIVVAGMGLAAWHRYGGSADAQTPPNVQTPIPVDAAPAIRSAKVQLGYTTITSPLDGRTGARLVDQGNIVHASDTTGIVVITQLRPIYVVFTLAEENLEEIARQMAVAPLKVVALGRNEK